MRPFLRQLKKLQHITPDNEWKREAREKLLFEIKSSTSYRAVETQESNKFTGSLNFLRGSLSFILPEKRTLQLLKPAGALFSISLLVLSSGIFTVSASQATIPGDTLYKLKLATEKVQRVLTASEPKKAELEITFAGKRIDELEKIVNDSIVPEEEQDEKVTEVIIKFNENITSAQATLEDLQHSESTEDTLSLAEVIDDKVTEYAEVLKEVADEVSDEVKEAVEDARASAEANGDAALVVIVEQHEEGAAEIDGEELVSKVDTKITAVEELLAELDLVIIDLTNATSTKDFGTIDSDSETATSTENLLAEQDEIIEEATKALEEAKQLVDDGELGGALSKTSDTKILVKEAIEIIEEVADAIEEMSSDSVTVEGIATSTEPVIAAPDGEVLDEAVTTDEEASDEAEIISQTESSEEMTVTDSNSESLSMTF